MSRFLPLSDADRQDMLRRIGAERIDTLFESIPADGRFPGTLDVPKLSEQELVAEFKNLASRNLTDIRSFAGAGVYAHYIPASVDAIAAREEFLTAYTPYQPEISQGTLQTIFEYQSLMCEITGMDVSNASMYDGATAFAEGILMAHRASKKRNTVLVSGAIHPHYRKVAEVYLRNLGIRMVMIPASNYAMDLDVLADAVGDDDVFAVAFGYPNFFGVVEPIDRITEMVREQNPKALLITVTQEPMAFGLIAPPGEFGVDIAVGEAQSFGNYPAFGGPLLGFLTTQDKLVRHMPGRVCGRTRDLDGKTGYVLTLSAREQHIRREKATSNICSNQGWCMLRAAVYLSLLGRDGFVEVAQLNHDLAEYARERINGTAGFTVFQQPTFNEFVVTARNGLDEFRKRAIASGVFPGVRLGKFGLDKNSFLVAVTEMNSTADIDQLVSLMEVTG